MEQQFPMIQVMNNDGELVMTEYREQITKELAMTFYRHLMRTRTFDRKCVSLQRQGRIGTYAPYEGQEAAQVGSALALKDDDWLFPTYRDHGATMTFGHSLTRILLYWRGRNEGCVPPNGKKIFPPSVPIATQLPHAAGAAYAEKRKGTKNAAIVYFGDGATSEGDFHEGLNIASVFQAPVVFFNQNNQYAISVPITKQMNSQTIAQKALAYDIPGVRVDGNDVLAVYFETQKALERARNGEGPTLIEAITWRYGAHTTADDPTKYRNQDESKKRRELADPIQRLERFMKREGFWDETWAQSVQEEVGREVEQAITEMENYPEAKSDDMFDYVFAQPTWTIEQQKNEYNAWKRGSIR
ncbi:pyruvate dehydrogenase (acetyl-transferring) E1 component subunit alpha [Anoxybacillus rupiensis]|jgi:2-oxoisovalerate dehydrogenase E1 component alpha subunit|uniref:Pyruvate dehydrogenase E1 component subunit alpha n=1 Tax=Anoxybacteroides rupiense TaxID=311460 RepID=A0ABT5W2N2_9BACL|nr:MULTISPECIES: pyruvate dehydrogenase (acetyl-transferring) E1 component subunit alpha [Anoxybacillus]MBB3908450.1 pyruvate dehydrogenase E1 component alpha subunit [Anoxybacillus rupiensis]MBS2770915.1 pyruvate dehydrogenase (acetyl-transferring) E1 component subunit alpha [Anoxybacillus rupiensis]MDE8563572.1 pyruvate dehydrogenase (acetyl-transferring) E1 component subunit alpha [Anoxybacillus rupiensis]QHC04361.1 pyruvate dehydrogenase (acetyl-transferring) E1 component subunit alpha [Ano